MPERPRRLIVPLAAAVLLVAALVLSACGGGGSSEDAQKIINETFSGQKQVDSGKLNLELEAKLDATGLAKTQVGDNPIKISLTGPFEQTGKNSLPKFDFDLTASAAGQSFSAGAISTGTAGYISYQGTDYKLDSKTFQNFKSNFEKEQAQNQKDKPASLTALGVDPKKWITDAKDEGTADVGGTETNHVSATIDIPAFLDDVNNLLSKSSQLNLNAQQQAQLPKNLTDQQKKQLQDAVDEATIDVYSGKDDSILRKLVVNFKFKVPDSAKAQSQGINGGEITLSVEIDDVNQPQEINAPKNAKSLKDLQSALSASPLGALGGAAGGAGAIPPTGSGSGSSGSSGSGSSSGSSSGGGSSGGSAGGTGAANSEQAQKYLDCIQKAAGDTAKIQKCAAQLSQ